jgi:hypothetical protein
VISTARRLHHSEACSTGRRVLHCRIVSSLLHEKTNDIFPFSLLPLSNSSCSSDPVQCKCAVYGMIPPIQKTALLHGQLSLTAPHNLKNPHQITVQYTKKEKKLKPFRLLITIPGELKTESQVALGHSVDKLAVDNRRENKTRHD